MSTKIEGGARFDSWLPEEEMCTSETFAKVNQRLSWYLQEVTNWSKAKILSLFKDLTVDIAILEENLAPRVAKITPENEAELAPLIEKTRSCLKALKTNENFLYYNSYIASFEPEKVIEGYNYRRKLDQLEFALFTKDSDCVKYYAEKLSGYPEKLKVWNKKPRDFDDFSQDLDDYKKCLFKRVERLTTEEISSLKCVLSVASAALQKIKTNVKIIENLSYYQKHLGHYNPKLEKSHFNVVEAVGQVLASLEAQTGASLGLYRLFQMIKLFEKPEERVLVATCDGVDMGLAETVGGTEQERVKDYLEGIYIALFEESTVCQVTTLQLLNLKIAAGWMMANYEKYMASGTDLTEAIFDGLEKISGLLNKRLKERGEEVQALVKKDVSLKSSLIHLQHYLRYNTYFSRFWVEPKHVEKLLKHAGCIQDYIQLLAKKDLMVESLTFVTADEEAGLRIYEKDGEVFVFCSGTEKYSEYWNIMQERKISVLAGGLGHKPVMDKAEKALDALNELIENSTKEGTLDWKKVKAVNFTGFGLDGAVSQLLAYNFASKNKEMDVNAFCLGTPAYLDRNSAAKISGTANLYSINFALVGDSALKTNYSLLKPIQKRWSSASFITYPLYNSDWFVSDWSGHWDENYLANAESALKFPIKMHEMHREIGKLLHPESQ